MLRLTLEQIRAFLAVTRAGGVRRAAQGLNLSQPAVTARLHKLEESLGRTLFDRSGGGLTLTREGELFLPHAEKFEEVSEQISRAIIAPDHVEGWLRIGASETVTQTWLPDFVARLHHVFPRVQVELNVDISSNLRDALVAGETDLAFLLGPVSEPSVDNVALPPFPLMWYAAPGPEPEGGYLSRPVISYARNTRPYRELRSELLARIGPTVQIFPSSSLSAAFRLVETGLGVAALPEAMGRPLVEAGRIVAFDPGWRPDPLYFTASFPGAPRAHVTETAVGLALDAARRVEAISSIDRM
ncbi:MAG: LysR family transcriptional regulator [Pseudomonadota bacterium]